MAESLDKAGITLMREEKQFIPKKTILEIYD